MSKNKNATVQEKVKEFFAKNKDVDRVYVTSDGQLFRAEHYANNWACELKDRTVTVNNRMVLEAIENVKEKLKAKEVGSAPQSDVDPEGSGSGAAATDDRDALVKEFIELFDTKPAHNIGLDKLKERIAEKKAELASIQHVVTEEDLVNNTELAKEGVKVGDEIELPNEQ